MTTLGLSGAMLFGRTLDRNLDHPDNWPVFEAAAALRVPLYIHPQAPVPVCDALYGGLGADLDAALSTFGLGWHYETGVQIPRMILAGVFDRYPDVQLVTGHWGEVVPFYLDRIDGLSRVTALERPVSVATRSHMAIGNGWSPVSGGADPSVVRAIADRDDPLAKVPRNHPE